ncbi:pyridoxal phosphate-dependent decarboxylase family protein [Mesorhizobium sp. LjNodule214]|uniref:pyridoxal phosphate-dependent decarboxylase family protein n=1 Tax=Mesorhizobium sp. LjNodule214 TaxID=3342252 RepID=UPI003ECFC2EF
MAKDGFTVAGLAAAIAADYRQNPQRLHSLAGVEELRAGFDIGLPDIGRPSDQVIDHLVRAAGPGLVGNTQPGFHGWVMGSSHPAGVAADWLTSAWGQNAAIYHTSPAAAVAEEISAKWLLDLLDLPRTAAVGFTSGATMAGFIGLAAARGEVLRRVGCDIAREGLQGAPLIKVFISDESHASNFAALRYLGFGESNLVRIPANVQGVMDVAALTEALGSGSNGIDRAPKIIVCQAGHINSGAFDRFDAIADIAGRSGAWLHIDGAFGLWARAAPDLKMLAAGAERADSWGVDGHKWLQLPYENGFAIVSDPVALRRAMDIAAGYLTHSADDGRNPTHFGPELSRRARGFAVWTMLQTLGRHGIIDVIDNHCRAAKRLAGRLVDVPGVRVENDVVLNQLALTFGTESDETAQRNRATQAVCDRLNGTTNYFLRTAAWNARTILRVSVIGAGATIMAMDQLADDIHDAWRSFLAERHQGAGCC